MKSFSFSYKDNGLLMLCAHRGQSETSPENTIASFEEAKKLGARIMEIDTILSKDGEIVLSHDQTINRATYGEGVVSLMNLSEIQSYDANRGFESFQDVKIPTLEEVMVWSLDNTIGLEIEVKEKRNMEGYLAKLGELYSKYPDAKKLTMIISFNHHTLCDMKKYIPDIKTEAIIQARHVSFYQVIKACNADAVSIEYEMITPDIAKSIHDENIIIRSHVPRRTVMDSLIKAGYAPHQYLQYWKDGYIDILSNDDVGYLREICQWAD